MPITRINRRADGSPVTAPAMTVREFAAQLQHMIERGQGDLPVMASDARACYPFSTVVPFSPSGYPLALLIQPAPHLHFASRQLPYHSPTYLDERNAEADQIRARCGAFA